MNRKSFLASLLMAIVAPCLPKIFLVTPASNPEVTAPLDKLKGMLGDSGRKLKVDIKAAIRGRDLLISRNRLN